MDNPGAASSLTVFIDYASKKGKLLLFIPWAAGKNGRNQITDKEIKTVDWLFGEAGLVAKIGQLVLVNTILMPADSYAQRNGLDMLKANQYWQSLKDLVGPRKDIGFVNSSAIESLPIMQEYFAKDAYAYEKLDFAARAQIAESAEKYSIKQIEDEESASDYCTYRAAEARLIEQDLFALWVSLNWPNRDAMCGDAPRIYIADDLKTPWLKD